MVFDRENRQVAIRCQCRWMLKSSWLVISHIFMCLRQQWASVVQCCEEKYYIPAVLPIYALPTYATLINVQVMLHTCLSGANFHDLCCMEHRVTKIKCKVLRQVGRARPVEKIQRTVWLDEAHIQQRNKISILSSNMDFANNRVKDQTPTRTP